MMRLFPGPPPEGEGGFESCLPSGVTVRHRTCDDSTRDDEGNCGCKGSSESDAYAALFRLFFRNTIKLKGLKKIQARNNAESSL